MGFAQPFVHIRKLQWRHKYVENPGHMLDEHYLLAAWNNWHYTIITTTSQLEQAQQTPQILESYGRSSSCVCLRNFHQ